MKKNLTRAVLLSFITATLSLADNLAVENSYYEAYKNESGLEDEKLISFTKDINYQDGMKYLIDERYFDTKKINKAENYSEVGADFQDVAVPNYIKALESLKKSAIENNNPISAYTGAYIIQTYTNMQNQEYLQMFVKFSEIMYNQETRICQAYLNYGAVFENGYYTEKNEDKAVEIFKEGLKDKKCQKGWKSAILNSKILSYKQAKEQRDAKKKN